MIQNTTRRPFVAPLLKEQKSLANVTLISGGTGGPTGGQSQRRGSHRRD